MRGSVAVQVPKVDPNRCGPDVRQGVNNRIAGSGTALCNTNVLQDRMYFEVKIINPDGASLQTPPAAPEPRFGAASRPIFSLRPIFLPVLYAGRRAPGPRPSAGESSGPKSFQYWDDFILVWMISS